MSVIKLGNDGDFSCWAPFLLQAFFDYLDILVFVEATIYQADETNEFYARQGLLLPQAHSDCELLLSLNP